MNATQFIKDHGLEKAREVVKGAPEWAFGYDFIDDDYFDGADIQDGYSIDQCDGCVCVDELKRLVESVDRINASGGIYGFKTYCNGDYQEQDLVDIRNYESIYGEEGVSHE